jgi:hypothetical protein
MYISYNIIYITPIGDRMTSFSKIKQVSISSLRFVSIFGPIYGVGYYIYNENNTKKYNLSNTRPKIKRIIGDNNIKKFNPEDIYALQFTEKKREYYKRYVTYPGNIITGVLFPASVVLMLGGICSLSITPFIFGGCLHELALGSNIVNNKISKFLAKDNLIIEKNDFLTIDEINYCHKIDTFDIEDHYTYSRQDALRQK